ncbi:MAG: AAA family ATPase [Planctomycetota bacterium]
MRFERLHMRPYGAFRDRALEFQPGAGLHLVFGSNGAGKSTTLEALRSVLFGIVPGNKVHKSSDLRIGAKLHAADGRVLEFVRRTSINNPIWNAADDAPLAPELLTPFLGNLDREYFESVFGLDLETLVEGGSALLEGKGKLGQALFAALLGGKRVGGVTKRLEDEVRSLYVEGSPKSRIQVLEKEHAALAKELRRQSLPARSHVADRDAFRALAKEAQDADAQLRQQRLHQQELRALARACAALEELEVKRRERAELGAAEPLAEASASRTIELFHERERLDVETTDEARELYDVHQKQADAVRRADARVLAAEAEIDALRQRLQAFRDASGALERARGELATLVAECDEVSRRAGVAGDALPADRAEPATLEDLGEVVEVLSQRLTRAESASTSARQELRKAEPKTAAAAARFERWRELAAEQLAVELEGLAPFAGTLEDLAAVAMPPDHALRERVATEVAEASAAEGLARELGVLEQRVIEVENALVDGAQYDDGPPPTRAEVAAARVRRDELLTALVQADAREPRAVIELQRAVSAADALVDRWARDSASAAEREARTAELERLTERRDALEAQRREAAEQAARSRSAWAEAWPLGALAALSASELEAWGERRRLTLKRAEGLRDEAQAAWDAARAAEAERAAMLAAAEEELARETGEWSAWARAHGLDPAASPDAARRRLRTLAGVRTLERDIARVERELRGHAATVERFSEDVGELAQRLALRVDEPALALSPPSEAPDGRGDSSFSEALFVARAVARTEALHHALAAARQAADEERHGKQAIRKLESRAKPRAERRAAIGEELAALWREAGFESEVELRRAADDSSRVRNLDADIDRLEAELRRHGAGADAAALATRLDGRTQGELERELETLEASIAELEVAARERSERLGALRVLLEAPGGDEASVTRARMADLEAQLVEATERYLRARLAEHLLTREIERNRQETQGPLLARAQELFRTLTLGAYVRLHPSEDAGKPIMVARRPNDQQVLVGGLSSGTCDQLYLALRIATVEHLLKTTEPMPFIADDLFVNFDDERTEAALRVLAELSKSTQVIVFSHHQSVVDTALRLTDEGLTVDVIRLPGEVQRDRIASASDVAAPGVEQG